MCCVGILCRLHGSPIQTLPAVQGLTPDLRSTLPAGDLGHHGGNAVAIRRLEFLQVFAEALAPDLRVADLRADIFSLEKSAEVLAGVPHVKGRVEVVPTPGKDYTILIDYAHSPDGLENVLSSVKGFAKGRTIALFGCGGDRDKTKRPKMGKVAADLADFAIVTTDNPRTEVPADIIRDILPGFESSDTPYIVVEDRIQAIHWAMDHAEKGDVIVLCGKGHETYQEINHVKHHMDEREIVADYLNAGK